MGVWGQARWAVWNRRMVAFGAGQDAALRIASAKAVPFAPSVQRVRRPPTEPGPSRAACFPLRLIERPAFAPDARALGDGT